MQAVAISLYGINGVPFDTTTTPSLTYTKDTGTDDITAQVIPSTPCISASSMPQPISVAGKTEGINNVSLQSISIYPNPAHTTITVTGSNITNITLTNTIGQTLLTQQATSRTTVLNISFLPAGIYLLAVTNNEGEKTVSKIVKE